MERDKTVDSKYIQQHLANERTFLAWVRTAITIIGLGFLAAGVVFRTTPYTVYGHTIASVVGVGSVLLGSILVANASRNYRRKREAINAETFRASKGLVWFVVCALMTINLLLIVLVVLLLVV